MWKLVNMMPAAIGAAILLGGCAPKAEARNDTSSAVPKTETEAEAPVLETAVRSAAEAEKADKAHLREQLDELTEHARSSGSEGETASADYLYGYFVKLGYETSQQKFTQKALREEEQDVSGTNVIAVKKADVNPDQADILIISAHHDGKPGIEGACDDASGVSVMMEAAYLVRNLATDTEVRFISFSGEENGRIGSRCYVEQMTEEEKARVIGDIQLDEIGYINSDYLELGTVDGQPVLLGNMLSQKAEKTRNLGRAIPYHKEVMSDHHSFSVYGMPAVLLSQNSSAFENHSVLDTVNILDYRKLTQTAQLVADVAAELMSDSTMPFRGQEDSTISPAQTGFQVLKDTQLYFGMDRNFIENQMALSGQPDHTETNEYGDTVEYYRYPVRWFNMDSAVDSLFTYRNGYLEEIEIPYGTAVTREQITAALGQPDENPTDLGTEYDWEDRDGHKFYSLTPVENDGFQLMVRDFSFGRETQRTYDLSAGFDNLKADNEKDEKLLKLLADLIYPEDLALMQFSVYTDGLGGTLGYSSGLTDGSNRVMEYALDETDAFDESGEWRDYHKTIRTAVHEYGHILSLNSSQVSLNKQDNTMPPVFYPKETYTQSASLRAYYERFWKNLDVKSGLERYAEVPEEFVSAYGAGNMSEDFAEAFMLFMLGNKPEDNSLAAEKILFFYDYEEFVARRDQIRMHLGLADPEEHRNPIEDTKEGNYRISLDGNPTTGYSWTYVMEPADVVKEEESGFQRNYTDTDLVGAGGTYVFDFEGLKEGTAVLTFTYSRSWKEQTERQKRVFELTVDGKNQVTGREITENTP